MKIPSPNGRYTGSVYIIHSNALINRKRDIRESGWYPITTRPSTFIYCHMLWGMVNRVFITKGYANNNILS